MLIDTQYLNNSKQLLVSYIDRSGDFKVKYIPWIKPFKYEICDHKDKDRDPVFTSWDRRAIKKVYNTIPDRYSTYEFLDALPPETQEEIFEYSLPKIYFIDIETEVIDGFPNPRVAAEAITTISIVYDNKIILLGVKDLSDVEQKEILDETNSYFKEFNANYVLRYIKFEDEFDMLYYFFNNAFKKMTCVTGWNVLDFDISFLINRARRITKKDSMGRTINIDPRVCSVTNRLNEIWKTPYEVPAHKLIFDYMQLYEALDTSVKIKESSSLDFVSNAILGVKKIEYEGQLNDLYRTDFKKFMLYNAVDSVLVQQLHIKTNFLSIIFGISALARIKANDVYSQVNNALGSLAITEGVLRKGFREEENIILFKDKNAAPFNGSSITGGFVFDPAVGMNRWVVCYDFASLYPTTQRQFFIAPENFVGKQDKLNTSVAIDLNGNQINITNDMVVCVNGSVFRKRNSPTIKMLKNVYADRKKNKKIMNEKKFQKDDLLKERERLVKMLEEST